MTSLRCAPTCPVVTGLVIAQARSTGDTEDVVRLKHGIPDRAPPEPPALVADRIRASAPTTDPLGWLQAVAHHLTHQEIA